MAIERLRPWFKLPGELHDKRGVPIYPGDLLKTYHFTDGRGRKRWLYHTAVFVEGHMRMVPTCHLQPDRVKGGGECLMTEELAAAAQVISGTGPEGCLDYTDRPRQRLATQPTT